MMMSYDDKEFKSISSGDLGLESEAEKEENKKLSEENKDMFEFIKESLGGKIKAAKVSDRLKSHPVCLTNEGQISLEMEKVLNQMPENQNVSAEKVLEINPNHEIFKTMQELYANDKDKLKDYANILYTQALLIEGMPIDDPVAYSNLVCKLMTNK